MKIEKRKMNRRAFAEREDINIESRTVPFILVSDDNSGIRYDLWEGKEFEEVLEVEGAKFDELNTFFKDHTKSVDAAIGKVINKRIEDGQVKADVVFGKDEDNIFNKYVEGILTDVSIGYSIEKFKEEKREGQPDLVTIEEFNIVELSSVWKGFDKKAKVGRNITEKELEQIINKRIEDKKPKRDNERINRIKKLTGLIKTGSNK